MQVVYIGYERHRDILMSSGGRGILDVTYDPGVDAMYRIDGRKDRRNKSGFTPARAVFSPFHPFSVRHPHQIDAIDPSASAAMPASSP